MIKRKLMLHYVVSSVISTKDNLILVTSVYARTVNSSAMHEGYRSNIII